MQAAKLTGTCLELVQELRPLVAASVEKMKSDGSWLPQLERTERNICDDFRYTAETQGPSSWTTEEGTEEDWSIARIRLNRLLQANAAVKQFEARLIEIGGPGYPARHKLDALIGRIAAGFQGNGSPVGDESLAGLLAHDISGKPSEQTLIGRAMGLILLAGPVALEIPGGEVLLEPFTKEMFERPRRISRYIPESFPGEIPTAQVTVRMVTLAQADVQRVLEKTKIIASLFQPCNLEIYDYSMSSSALASPGGRMSSGRQFQAKRPLVLQAGDVAAFRKFWAALWQTFPFDPFGPKSENPASVALGRYTEACTEPRTPEYSMTTVMMGLESLFTEGAPEISYRLRQRSAAFLAPTGLNPHTIHATIQNGYGIRSTLVHGGSLSYKERRRVEANYGSLDNLLLRNLDLLRISVLLMLLTKMDKERLLDLLDESMFDAKKREELVNIVGQYKLNLGKLTITLGQ